MTTADHNQDAQTRSNPNTGPAPRKQETLLTQIIRRIIRSIWK